MKRFLLPILCSVSLLMTACGSNDEQVTKAQLGEKWPFTVDAVTVGCDGINQYVITPDGSAYALNGAASSKRGEDGKRKYESLEAIWQPDTTNGPGAHKDLTPIMAMAAKHCK